MSDRYPGVYASSGLFVCFEGGEGAGKSTQTRLLKQALEAAGHVVLQTFEPEVDHAFHLAMPMPAIYHLEHDGVGWRVMGGHGFAVGSPTVH